VEDVKKSKIPLRVGLDNDIEIPVDKVRITQVIQTILNNSLKYTESGYIKVESFVAHQQNQVIIRINDTGQGIPKETLHKIFEQGIIKNHINDEKLSLYLCNGIVEAHGGKLSAKNNATDGCTFTFTLPIK